MWPFDRFRVVISLEGSVTLTLDLWEATASILKSVELPQAKLHQISLLMRFTGERLRGEEAVSQCISGGNSSFWIECEKALKEVERFFINPK